MDWWMYYLYSIALVASYCAISTHECLGGMRINPLNTGLYFFLCRAVHNLHVYETATKASSAQNEIDSFSFAFPDVVYARSAT